MTDYVIAPSILSADMARLGEDSASVIAAGADFIHVDVMDNHFVPNLTFGPVVVKALRDFGITAPLDVHLMIKPVDRIIPEFAEAGASYATPLSRTRAGQDRHGTADVGQPRLWRAIIHTVGTGQIETGQTDDRQFRLRYPSRNRRWCKGRQYSTDRRSRC